jgi:hypothetical protein
MTLTTSRQFHLLFVQSAYSADAATYGSEEYGADPFSYGQEATESVNPSTQYSLLPTLGQHPEEPAWIYRVGDENPFSCSIIEHDNPAVNIDVTPVAVADVVLTEIRFDDELPWYRRFALTPDEVNDRLERTWEVGDLTQQGRFRVTVRVEFESGRILTVEGNDGVWLQVNSSTDSEIPVGQNRGGFL